MRKLFILALLALLSTQAMAYEVPNIAAAGSRSRIVCFDTFASREADLAMRESVMAEREAELAKREAKIAEREAALAIRETRFDGNLPSETTAVKSEPMMDKPIQKSVRRGTVRYWMGGPLSGSAYSSGNCASGACGW